MGREHAGGEIATERAETVAGKRCSVLVSPALKRAGSAKKSVL